MKKIFIVLCLTLGMAFGVTNSTQADGLHPLVLTDGQVVEWRGGCFASVWIDAGSDQLYGPEIRQSLGMLAQVTGISFSQVTASQEATLRYQLVAPDQIGQYLLGQFDYYNSTVQLGNLKQVSLTRGRKGHNLRLNLVLHETMHWLGLGHDAETGGSNEIMDPLIIDTPVRGFGEGDLEGLAYISQLNGCAFSPQAIIARDRGVYRL